MKLSIFDLSKYLGVVPDTIERWVRQGKLPVSRKGDTYSFRSGDLKKWAAAHNLTLNDLDTDRPEKENESVISLSAAVENGGVYFDIQGSDVPGVLKASIERISRIQDEHKAELLGRLIEREQALSTGIGNGIAIPHPREQSSHLSQPMVSVCFLANPVDYKALDHQPVSVLFFLLCPALTMHLHLLSVLSFCLRDAAFINFLKSRPDPAQLVLEIERLQQANPF